MPAQLVMLVLSSLVLSVRIQTESVHHDTEPRPSTCTLLKNPDRRATSEPTVSVSYPGGAANLNPSSIIIHHIDTHGKHGAKSLRRDPHT